MVGFWGPFMRDGSISRSQIFGKSHITYLKKQQLEARRPQETSCRPLPSARGPLFRMWSILPPYWMYEDSKQGAHTREQRF